jgi:DNA invertase Pin-like site-specific DNA recombinase
MSKPDRIPAAPPANADGQEHRQSAPATQPVALRSSKIQDYHLTRLAVVYVRQSSPQQILNHRESCERQYALAGHAAALGWRKERILIIDLDQGKSGRSVEQRAGFQRLLEEVNMGHVGLILALEMSRLARSNKDWHNLLERCTVFSTLLADQDGVYDPRNSNDRLLLGLKGTMSEFELVTMRNRLHDGTRNKARRCELFIHVPFGYVKLPTGEVVLDPDEQVRAVVQLIFDKFAALGSLAKVFRYLIRNDIRIGMRAGTGTHYGQVQWRRATVSALRTLFHHPLYAGAYAHGRSVLDPTRISARTGKPIRSSLPIEQWAVLKRDVLPAYISWEQYLANRQRLEQNRFREKTMGNARRGTALVSGLVVCGTCGRRLYTAYHHTNIAHYCCTRYALEEFKPNCPSVKAAAVDDVVADAVLRALAPAGLEASMQALANIQKERERLQQHWQQQLERARYEAERAERQYHAAEPENRLVARTLEQRWEEALRRQQQLQEDYDRFLRSQPGELTDQDRAKILALANDLPALWHAPQTTPADRKEIVRCLVERVVVDVRRNSEVVGVTICWRGGATSTQQAVRPVKGFAQLGAYEQLLEHVVELRRQGYSAPGIAAKLNEEGYRTPRRRRLFTTDIVRQLLSRRGLSGERSAATHLGPQEWWMADLARKLGMEVAKLRRWIVHGWLHARRTPGAGMWIVWADRDELKRLRKLVARSTQGVTSHPQELTTPKKRSTK